MERYSALPASEGMYWISASERGQVERVQSCVVEDISAGKVGDVEA